MLNANGLLLIIRIATTLFEPEPPLTICSLVSFSVRHDDTLFGRKMRSTSTVRHASSRLDKNIGGWQDVEVIDDDLGQSASGAITRSTLNA